LSLEESAGAARRLPEGHLDAKPAMAPESLQIHFGAIMANLSIKDVPESLAQALRQRAARNHRSLQGELMAIIERAANDSAQTAQPGPADVSLAAPRRGAVRRGWKTIEQVYAEHLARYPKPFTEGPMSADIIRQDRDRR
jgi:plasmid stability protein